MFKFIVSCCLFWFVRLRFAGDCMLWMHWLCYVRFGFRCLVLLFVCLWVCRLIVNLSI